MVPIDFALPPLWSVSIRLFLSLWTSNWWSIIDMMNLYKVLKQVIGCWSEADGLSFSVIITLLPMVSQAGISGLSVSIVFNADAMSPWKASIFFIQ